MLNCSALVIIIDTWIKSRSKKNLTLEVHVEYNVYSFREIGLEEAVSVTYQK